MPYCSKCGVEVDNHILNCPLCKTPIQQYGQNSQGSNKYPKISPTKELSNKQKRIIAWEIITGTLVTAFLVVLTVNLSVKGKITWASYPMTGIGAAWLYMTFLLLFLQGITLEKREAKLDFL